MTYNLYPEPPAFESCMSKSLPRLLDVMPFLHRSQDKAVNSSMWPEMQLPMDNSIKAWFQWTFGPESRP